MRKLSTKILAGSMVISVLCSAVACNIGTTVIEDVDKSKTQLYIASFSGGAGYKWMDDVEVRFEEKYAETSFEEGKKGVQVIIDHSKSNKGTSIGTNDFDLYFTGGVTYFDAVASNLLMDISDVVTGVNPNDNKTIESKLTTEKQNALKVNGKYYAIPYADYYNGISYDAGLFNDYKLYFSNQLDTSDTTYPGTNKFVTAKNAKNLSCGPDAVYGTYDDGLPSTYQEFYKLMDRMIKGAGGEKITPFAFTGVSTHYTNMLIHALSANYVGATGWNANFIFDSKGTEVEIVTDFVNGQPVVGKVAIDENNAYKLKSSLGIYYASEFCEKVFTNEQYFDTTCASESSTNLATMERYLRSGWDSASPTPIAMIIDGSYWFNEAISEGIVDRVRKLDPEGNNNVKDVRFMPLPHQYAGTVTPQETPVSQVLVNNGLHFAVMNAKTPVERIEVAKLFLSFCYSDEELAKAELSNNGVARGLIYDTSSIQNDLTPYAKALNSMKNQAIENNTMLDGFSQHPIYAKNGRYFEINTGDYWKTSLDADYSDVYTAFYSTKCSAKDYFQGIQISESLWKSNFMP